MEEPSFSIQLRKYLQQADQQGKYHPWDSMYPSYNTFLMNGFNIRLLNTTATTLTGYAAGMTTVYSGSYTVPGNGWQMITLQNNFVWDGVSNLLLEICFDNTAYGYYSFVYASAATNQAIYYYTDNAAGCSFTSAYTGTYLPNLRFVEQPWVGTLTGTITNCYNGSSLNGVTVTCGTQSTTTNAAGFYTLYNVVVGTYNVQYSLPNFVTKTIPATITNGNTTTIDACLDPVPAVLSGVVTNAANGNPVVGAKIETTTGGYFTYSTGGGAYTLNIYPANTFNFKVTKAGFDDATARSHHPYTRCDRNAELCTL